MNKTFTINLGGKVFNIDDDALDILQKYINTLKAHYAKGEDGDEIMYDIVGWPSYSWNPKNRISGKP